MGSAGHGESGKEEAVDKATEKAREGAKEEARAEVKERDEVREALRSALLKEVGKRVSKARWEDVGRIVRTADTKRAVDSILRSRPNTTLDLELIKALAEGEARSITAQCKITTPRLRPPGNNR